MNLKKLSDCLSAKKLTGNAHIDITAITADSRTAQENSLFVAVPGTRSDGHRYLEAAFARGARAFVTETPFAPPGATNIIVPDSRSALARLAAEFYGQPSADLHLVGITGTNGKTTAAFLIESILNTAGRPAGLLSTVIYRFKDRTFPATHTTPGPVELQHMLRRMADAGVRYAVMEVSSHGLLQKRTESCDFNTAVFTNLSPEHLDYHTTMADYLNAKMVLFTNLLDQSRKQAPLAVINRDDPAGRKIAEKTTRPVFTYGIAHGDMHTRKMAVSLDGISADLVTAGQRFTIHSKLIGRFNIYNILAAAAASLSLGISTEHIRQGLKNAKPVPGRMESLANNRGIHIFIDYAHTGDALENVLSTLRHLVHRRIITIFGCGGDRDRRKRPEMGKIAARYSNILLVTSDNPRSEDPNRIIQEIEAGIAREQWKRKSRPTAGSSKDKVYFVVPDRRTAIRSGIRMAEIGDAVLIAGKGHETCQIIGSTKTHFDDREEALSALKNSD